MTENLLRDRVRKVTQAGILDQKFASHTRTVGLLHPHLPKRVPVRKAHSRDGAGKVRQFLIKQKSDQDMDEDLRYTNRIIQRGRATLMAKFMPDGPEEWTADSNQVTLIPSNNS